MTDHKINVQLDPRLAQILMDQDVFQGRVIGSRPAELQGSEKKEYIREQALALSDELHEALAEVGWKSWATSNHFNRAAYAGELADVFIFLMNLMLVGNISGTELLDLVEAKQAKNHKRQDDGYDGVSTKCPACHRAYDDDAVKCRAPGESVPGWCEATNHYVHTRISS